MNCTKTQEYLSSYYDDLLEEDLRSLVETHLSTCDNCRKDYDALRNALSALASLEDVKAPKELIKEVNLRIDRSQKKPSLWERIFSSRILIIAPQVASVALFIVMGVLVYHMYGMFTRLDDQNIAPAKRSGKISMSIDRDLEEPQAGESSSLVDATRGLQRPSGGFASTMASRSSRVTGKLDKASRSKAEVRKDDDIEVVPCRNDSEDMDARIERLVTRWNGNIVRLKRGPEAKRELLIRIPMSSYPNFMGRLKRVVDEKEKLKETRKAPAKGKIRPMMLRSMKSMQEDASPDEVQNVQEQTKTEAKESISEVKLIKVVYE